MMRKLNIRQSLYMSLLFLLSAYILCCCVDDHNLENYSSDDSTAITFNVTLPSGVKTYALGDNDENNVSHIYVLAFTWSDGKYILSDWSSASADSIVNSGNTAYKKKFTVNFTQLNQGDSYKFVLLANVKNDIGHNLLSKGAEKDALLSGLLLSGIDRWNIDTSTSGYRDIPMWGETPSQDGSGDKKVTPDMNITGLSLLRMLARINVTVDGLGSSPATGYFKLESVSLYNTHKGGRIVPDVDNLADGSISKVKCPTLIEEDDVYAVPVDYDKNTPGCSLSEVALTNTIYTFESAVPHDDLFGGVITDQVFCLVIGGKYKGEEQTTYYRVDLINKDKIYLDILRNHSYNVCIKEVIGRGYELQEDAFRSKAVNIIAKVVDWNDGEWGDIIDDNQYVLSVNPGIEFEFSKDADSQVAQIKTDYPDGWMITKITGSDGTPIGADGWLTVDKSVGDLLGSGGYMADLAINVTENNTGEPRVGYIYLRFGRTDAKLTITQIASTKLSIITSVSGRSVTEILFTGLDLGPKVLDVDWYPKKSDLSVTSFSFNQFLSLSSAFTGLPQNGAVSGSNGKKEYSITAPAFTPAELAANPFLDRMSRFEFMTYREAEHTVASVLIRQINFDLISDSRLTYAFNGSRYSFYVRSNCNWVITAVKENYTLMGNDNILFSKKPSAGDNLCKNTTGGKNVSQGDLLSFTTANTDTKGNVSVTFHSPENRFKDKTIIFGANVAAFAGSNIYYDENLGHLTFADANDRSKETYQGVYFKWGSLYGISPVGTAQNASIYSPHGGIASGTKWADVAFVPTALTDNKKQNYLYDNTDAISNPDAKFGDICKWLTDKGYAPGAPVRKWRMPTSDDFELAKDYARIGDGWNSLTSNSAFGKDSRYVSGYTKTSAFTSYFPASGYRGNTGAISASNIYGLYWSASPSGTNSYSLSFTYNNDVQADRIPYAGRITAFPIRCVLE